MTRSALVSTFAESSDRSAWLPSNWWSAQTPTLLQCKDSETAPGGAEVAEKTDEKGKQDDQPVAYIFFCVFCALCG